MRNMRCTAGTRAETITEVEDLHPDHRLRRSLGWPHLVALGVGAIVGTGIYTLIGVGAGLAGPGGDPVVRGRRRGLRLRGALPTPRWPP